MNLGLLVGCSLAAAGAGLLERLRRHRQILDQQKRQLQRTRDQLQTKDEEIVKIRSVLETTSQELVLTMAKLEETKGELGTRTSENQLIKSSYHLLKRQHEQTQIQLQGANMQLRSAITEGMWDD